ncbi:MAG: AIR synthase family protein [Thermoprotei archaeon]
MFIGCVILRLGKIDRELFDSVIYPHLGVRLEEVVVGPKHGVDTGAIDLGDGRVMVVKTDPFFIVPQYGFRKAAWFAVHILASDVATSGIMPRYALIDLNLPPKIGEEELRDMWVGVHEALKEIGVMVVGGHTGVYEGTDYPMLGGFTMIGIGPKHTLGSPQKVEVGDSVIVTKGPAIEATALLVNTYPQHFKDKLEAEVYREAHELYWKMSCWRDGLIASQVGFHYMHDATEGGLWGALVEVAEAAGKHIRLNKEKLFINRAVDKVTKTVGIDPYTSISEGTMVIVTHRPAEVKTALKAEGIDAEVVGKIEEGSGVELVDEKGASTKIEHPREDPFWRAFSDLAKKHP